jgi:hypothetical protein
MKYITGFFAFWWDFIVGDAWEVAAGVLTLIVIVFALVQGTRAAWAINYAGLLLPVGVVVLLGVSLLALGRKR